MCLLEGLVQTDLKATIVDRVVVMGLCAQRQPKVSDRKEGFIFAGDTAQTISKGWGSMVFNRCGKWEIWDLDEAVHLHTQNQMNDEKNNNYKLQTCLAPVLAPSQATGLPPGQAWSFASRVFGGFTMRSSAAECSERKQRCRWRWRSAPYAAWWWKEKWRFEGWHGTWWSNLKRKGLIGSKDMRSIKLTWTQK